MHSIGEEVTLNVYEFVRFKGSLSTLALESMGLGVYHSGVELRGAEHSFTVDGIATTSPKLATACRWKMSVIVGYTMLSTSKVGRRPPPSRASPSPIGSSSQGTSWDMPRLVYLALCTSARHRTRAVAHGGGRFA
jgi:hypothetical protein